MVSIHRPLGYGPRTLPLRHSALPYCSLAVGSRALIAEIHCGKIAISLRSTCVNYYSEIVKYFQCVQKQFIEFAAFGVCQAFCCLVSIGLQARFEKLQLIISRPAKGGELLGMKLATGCPLKTSCRTSHPGFRLRFVKGNYTGVALTERLAEDGFDPSTSGLWAQHASAAPLCFISPQMGLEPTIPRLRGQCPIHSALSHCRGWFRSIDLWVMGPARSRCATLLHLTPDGTRTHNPWLRRPVPYPLGHWGQSAASRQPNRKSTRLNSSHTCISY